MSEPIHLDTLCARPPVDPERATRPVAPPIYLSSVYQIADLDQIDALYEGRAEGSIYARDGHPNGEMLATKVAALEGMDAAIVFASGMGAEAALLLSHLNAGDRVVISDGLYGRTVTLVTRELARFGIAWSTFDATRPETLADILDERTRIVFVETLSNPLVRVADLNAIAETAHQAGAILAVDNTFAPLICRPVDCGADAVIHSLTKLIGGHSDVTLGVLAGSNAIISQAVPVASTFGLTGNPFESWLTLRGFATLGLRSAKACANALDLCGRLEAHPKIGGVHYPGLESHPDHVLASRLLQGGFGAMAAIDLGSRESADRFIRGLRHVPFAPSLGDVTTTLSHPWTTSHRFQTDEDRARQGIAPGLVRLSFGIEDPADLWADFEQALALV